MGQGLCRTGSVASAGVSFAVVVCLVLLSRVSALAQALPENHKVAARVRLPDLVFVQTPQLATGPLAQRFPQGSSIVRFNPPSGRHNLIPLTQEFFAAADAQISFDGSKILFSAQKMRADHWQLWEMDVDGSRKRQVTRCAQDCLRGAYLPADEIVVTVEGNHDKKTPTYLAVIKTDGSDFHRITFGSAGFQLETVLRDGRIVASAPWPLVSSEGTGTSRLLYTLRPDGTALESFRCEHREKTMQSDAEELLDGALIFVQRALTGPSVGGQLMRVEQGDLHSAPLRVRTETYDSARQISEGQLVAAKQVTAAGNSAGRFDLYLLNAKTGALRERLYADSQLSSIEPAAILPRTVPKHYWNTLNPASNSGNFISLNSYLSLDDPHGRITTPISRVRILTLNSFDGQEENLGEAPVEPDGSFFVQIPANWPVRFVLLDASGQPISEEHSWIWTRPGEQRGCTGCHGDKAVAPDNHWPQTLRRFDTPRALGDTGHGSATTREK